MSDEYENSNVYYSAFWPLVIVLVGLIVWFGYQDVVLSIQRSAINQQFAQADPTVKQAIIARDRLISLMKDLVATSPKNQNAQQILKEAIEAGMINVNRTPNTGTNATATPAAPAAATDGSTPAK